MLYIRDMAPSARSLRLMKINDAEKEASRGASADRPTSRFGSALLMW
jgi:hypothetical protein